MFRDGRAVDLNHGKAFALAVLMDDSGDDLLPTPDSPYIMTLELYRATFSACRRVAFDSLLLKINSSVAPTGSICRESPKNVLGAVAEPSAGLFKLQIVPQLSEFFDQLKGIVRVTLNKAV
jgi:hypothetical protein